MKGLVFFLLFSSTSILVLVHANMEPFIVGGRYTKIKNFPYSIFLEASCGGIVWCCGSSLLTQKLIMTAAHCVYGCTRKGWTITGFAGHEYVDKMTLARNISRYIMHRAYIETDFANDIALGYLVKAMPLGKIVKRVMVLPSFPTTNDVVIAGWGSTSDVPEDAVRLKSVKQTLRSERICHKVYNKLYKPVSNRGMLCAENDIKNRPSVGDSGSALVTSDWKQIGLVSFRIEQVKETTIYTNVTFFYRWLHDTAIKLNCIKLWV